MLVRLLLLFAIPAAFANYVPLTESQLEAAFLADGFKVSKWVSYEGSRGALALSLNSTIRSNGQAKTAFYSEGSGYAQGYVIGLLDEPGITRMTTHYLQHIVPQLVAPSLDRLLNNNSLYEEFLTVLTDFVISSSTKSFNEQVAAGYIPQTLVDEMTGLVAGCVAANASTAVTLDRIITLNFGFDYLLAKIYSVTLWRDAALYIQEQEVASAKLIDFFLENMHDSAHLIKLPTVFCDAFGLSGKAVKPGSGPLFARDFQLATADVFQEVATMIISFPSDGRLPSVRVGAPGFVGGMTILNSLGVVAGVDVMRSAAANATMPGLNSLLLLRVLADTATDRANIISMVSNFHRGTPFLYPVCDGTGACAVLEASRSMSAAPFPALSYPEQSLLSSLPDQQFIDQHTSAPNLNGLFARLDNYVYPEDYLSFNDALFTHAELQYNTSSWGAHGFVFSQFQEEKQATLKIQNNYFPPQREVFDDVTIVSNAALVPEMRMSMMGVVPDLMQLASDSLQFRYDSLNALITENYGQIDFEKAKYLIQFLSPDRLPGYWNTPRVDPSDPMTMQVEGVISVIDIAERVIWSKYGYWCDGAVSLKLNNYYAVAK